MTDNRTLLQLWRCNKARAHLTDAELAAMLGIDEDDLRNVVAGGTARLPKTVERLERRTGLSALKMNETIQVLKLPERCRAKSTGRAFVVDPD